jgi:hypothetical protein
MTRPSLRQELRQVLSDYEHQHVGADEDYVDLARKGAEIGLARKLQTIISEHHPAEDLVAAREMLHAETEDGARVRAALGLTLSTDTVGRQLWGNVSSGWRQLNG